MPKPPKKSSTNPSSGDREPVSGMQRILKWAGGITAVLSFVFAVYHAIQMVSEFRERQREVAELYNVGKLQQGAADYERAWLSFEQALHKAETGNQLAKLMGQLGEERSKLRTAQEDLVMEWLANLSATGSGNQTFSEQVNKLVSVLHRGLGDASGARKADLLAHVGWADFLRWRDGQRNLKPEQHYRLALEADPGNPYAHAYWGHWQLWRRTDFEEAKQHFATALTAGREHDYVRKIQLAAFNNLGADGEGMLLRAVNDMRKNQEPINSEVRHNAYSIFWFHCRFQDQARAAKLLAEVPITEQIAMFQALFYEGAIDKQKRLELDFCLATLLESAQRREEALRILVALRDDLTPSEGDWRERIVVAIKRLSPRR